MPGIILGGHLLMAEAVCHQSEDVNKNSDGEEVWAERLKPTPSLGLRASAGSWGKGSEETLEITMSGSK